MKRKALDSSEKDRPALVKVPKLGAASSSPAKDPKVLSLHSRSGSAAKANGSSARAVEKPLAIMPITVWNPPAQSVRPPPSRVEELKRKDSEIGGDDDSLLLNAELAAGAISSPFLRILISRRRARCPLTRLWLYPSRGLPL